MDDVKVPEENLLPNAEGLKVGYHIYSVYCNAFQTRWIKDAPCVCPGIVLLSSSIFCSLLAKGVDQISQNLISPQYTNFEFWIIKCA